MPSEPLVLVTGVSGFIASWVAYAALDAGYRVRGTVRSLENQTKIAHLRDLCPSSKHKIELVAADLTSDEGWTDAVAGCYYVLHVACPFIVGEPKNPDDLIVPAVEGTLRVLRAVAALENLPKRVVLTSSVASISSGHNKLDFNADDWSDISNPTVSAYSRSKTMAERAAWSFVDSLPESKRFELAAINPAVVLGPMLSSNGCASADIIKKIILAQYPGLPSLHFGAVSVFDVARAHLLAMTKENAAGKRFILSPVTSGMREFASIINKVFMPLGYRPITMHVPNFLVQVFSFFGDREATAISGALGRRDTYDNSNARNILGLVFEEHVEVIVEQMARAAIAGGLIVDKSPGKVLSSEYVRPVFDTSMIPRAPNSDEFDL